MDIAALIPAPQMTEFHARVIDAPREQVWQAFVTLPAADLRLLGTLMRIRTLLLPRQEHRSASSAAATFLDASPVPLLDLTPSSYVLAGGVGRPWKDHRSPAGVTTSADVRDFDEPGWAKIAADFRFQPLGESTVLSTETRVATTDDASRRRMRLYWLVIRPFSGLIRREVLHQVARRVRTGPEAQ